MPKSNSEYWKGKIAKKIERDRYNRNALLRLGWRVVVIWECEIKKDFPGNLKFLSERLNHAG
jgi:DNA mismatch endonuclease (patch repair protein)